MTIMGPKVAIVTGAARGIGAAVAMRLAHDGYDIAVIDLNESDCECVISDITRTGRRSLAVGADIADEQAVTTAVASIAERLGPPTVLVNNAGITRDNMLFKLTSADWDSVLNVHLKGTFLMSREVQRHMVAQKWGRIVNLSSTSALGNRGQANYSAAKAGVQGFTRTLALELGKFGVTVNAVAPGFIETDMTAATAERLGVSFEDFKENVLKQIAVTRTGVPDDVANVVSFLVAEATDYVSGQIIYVAGGPTV